MQLNIRQRFGSVYPRPPTLKLRNVTQTSCVLEWSDMDLAESTLEDFSLWKNGSRLGTIPSPLATKLTKLSGLSIDLTYRFQLLLRCTAGMLYSNEIEVQTLKLTDLNGLRIATGILSSPQIESINSILEKVGAPPSEGKIDLSTTHFITSVGQGVDWENAKKANIPIVRVEWLQECQRSGRLIGVRNYYLDAIQPEAAAIPVPTPPSLESKEAVPEATAAHTDQPEISAENEQDVIGEPKQEGESTSIMDEVQPAVSESTDETQPTVPLDTITTNEEKEESPSPKEEKDAEQFNEVDI